MDGIFGLQYPGPAVICQPYVTPMKYYKQEVGCI